MLACALVALSAAGLSGCAGIVIGAGATAAVGASEERGLEGAVDDTKIQVQINDLWFRKDVEMYRKVGLDIYEGRVLLTGVVTSEQARADAVRLTWQASGVREVYNEIEVVSDGQDLSGYGHDTVVEEKLKTRLLFDGDVKNINYTVVAVNGVVYLIGIAQNEAELERVISHARDVTGVRRVVSHVIVKSDPRRVSG